MDAARSRALQFRSLAATGLAIFRSIAAGGPPTGTLTTLLDDVRPGWPAVAADQAARVSRLFIAGVQSAVSAATGLSGAARTDFSSKELVARYRPTYASLKKRRNAYVQDSRWQMCLQRLLQKVPSHE